MDFLTAAAAGKLAKLVHKLIELRAAASRRCNVTNENSAEQGLPLEDMDEAGLRHRLASNRAPGSANDNPDSPSTASASGIMTPRSDDNSESQGEDHVSNAHAR